MRHFMIMLPMLFFQGCSLDYCSGLDIQQFMEKEQLLACDQKQLTELEMDDCVKKRHADLYKFHEQYGAVYNDFLWNFDRYQYLMDDDFLLIYGSYLLASAFRSADTTDSNLVSATTFLLSKGVDPFLPFKTEIAPVGWLMEGVGISKATAETKAMWALVKQYYPPEGNNLATQVDLYIQHCRVKY